MKNKRTVKAPAKLALNMLFALSVFSTPLLAQDAAPSADNTQPSIEQLRAWYNQAPSNWPAADLSDGIALAELAPLKKPNLNPLQQQQVSLGEELFHDPILSRDQTVSCASCHEKRFVLSDARQKAIGIDRKLGPRNTPALFNLDLWHSFFWDGRAKTLQQQVLMPISDPVEMDLSVDEAVTRLENNAHYKAQFAKFYPNSKVTAEQLADVLSAFSLTLTAPRTRFDNFIEDAYSNEPNKVANASKVLSDTELQGLHLFRTKARCLNCHSGPLLSDNQFHVTGFHFFGRALEDLGRYNFTGKAEDSGKFRTPSLRAVSHTGPWMHNGNMVNMRGLIAFYNVGGPQPKKPEKHEKLDLWPQHSPLLKNLSLTAKEMDALVSFMDVL